MDSDMPYNIHTDLFALGSSLYHIMQRAPPYNDCEDNEVGEFYKRKLFPDLRDVACGNIIRRCGEKLSSANTALSLLYLQTLSVPPFLYIRCRLFVALRSWLRWGVAGVRRLRENWS